MFKEVEGRHAGAPRSKQWRKAGRCTTGNCVEVLRARSEVSVRDSKDLLADPDAPFPQIDIPTDKWSTFLAEVMDQTPQGTNGSLFFDVQPTGYVALSSADSDVVLTYDDAEWAAFKGGIKDGDFGPINTSSAN